MKYDTNEVASSFVKLEKELSLFELYIQNVPVWEWMRFDVYRSICQKVGTTSQDTRSQHDIQDYLSGVSLGIKNMYSRNPFVPKNVGRLYIGKGRRKKLEDGFWWDIYCDPIHHYGTHEYLQLDSPFNHEHREPAKTQNLRYVDVIRYTGALSKKTPYVGVTVSDSEKRKLRDVKSTFDDVYDIQLNLVSRVEDTLTQRKYTRPLYKKLLQRLNPNIVVVVCSYFKETILEVCSDMNIPTVELQHGVIHDSHLGYSFQGERTKETFPDYLLVWGDFWRETVEYPIPDEHVIPVGFPYLEQSVKKYDHNQSEDQILFISQGNIGEQLSKFAIKVQKNSDIEHNVVYKIHPKEHDRWKNKYPWLVNAGIDVIDSSDPPLYELFAESNIQVGVGSTAVYEGLTFGLETYVFDCAGSTVLQPLVDEGAASIITSADELASALGSGEGSFDREHYFESNATEQVCEAIRWIAENGTTFKG